MRAHDAYEKLPAKDRADVKNKTTTINKAKAGQRRKKTLKEESEAAAKAMKKKSKPWVITNKRAIIQCDALITDPPYGILDEPWEPAKLEEFTREWAGR